MSVCSRGRYYAAYAAPLTARIPALHASMQLYALHSCAGLGTNVGFPFTSFLEHG